MNKFRRSEILKAIDLIEQAKDILESVIEGEQIAFDNMPEWIQFSDRGSSLEDNIYDLEQVIDCFDTSTLIDFVER